MQGEGAVVGTVVGGDSNTATLSCKIEDRNVVESFVDVEKNVAFNSGTLLGGGFDVET